MEVRLQITMYLYPLFNHQCSLCLPYMFQPQAVLISTDSTLNYWDFML